MWQSSKFELSNGLTVYHQTYLENISAVVLLYCAGSSYERAGKTGIAHILEHLMFNGTSNFGPFSSYVEAFGGYDNAFTDRDVVVYHTVISADRLKDILLLEADRMVNLTFNNFESEKKVILEEYMLSENEDDDRLWTEAFAALWPDSPYSQPVIGWPSDVENLTLEDVMDFYERFYTPSNAILVVVSPHPLEEVKDMVEEAFGSIRPGPKIKHPVHKAPSYSWFKRINLNMRRPKRFILAFRLRQPSLRYNATLNLFTRILDLERSSPLWPLVEKGELEMFEVRNYEYRGGNVLAIVGEVSPQSDVPYESIMDILMNFSAQESALRRVKRMLKSELIFSYEDAESVGINTSFTAYLFGEVPTLEEMVSLYDEISPEEVESIVQELETSPRVLVRYSSSSTV